MVVRAAVQGLPLPGTDRPVRFPDLAFIMRHRAIFLMDDNLPEPLSLENSPKPLVILSLASLKEEVRKDGDIAYLQFGPPTFKANVLQLTLSGRLLRNDGFLSSLGLSDIHVKFQKIGEKWWAVSPPSFSTA